MQTPAAGRKLDACLKSSKDWARLSDHAERLLRLRQLYARIAPAYLAEGLANASQVANYKSGKIVIHAANGAVAAKLRQIEPSLRGEFCKSGAEVTQITVRVQVGDIATQRHMAAPQRRLPSQAAASLEALAGSLPAASPLAVALRDLLRRARR
jgi:hypothetical protein